MTKVLVLCSVIFIAVGTSMCKNDPVVIEHPLIDDTYDDTPYDLDIGSFAPPNFNDNPLTVTGVDLGRRLFYETALSGDNSMSCATCHKQENGFSDPEQFSIGIEGLPGKRQAMSVFNTAWHTNEFFWDGRAHLLRDQSIKPIEDPLEMNETHENVVAKLDITSDIYPRLFNRAFGSEEITIERISLALEQFTNSIVSNQSKYDRYLAGEVQLSESEMRGLDLYFTEYDQFFPDQSGADCAHCHGGTNFADNQYFNNGLDTEENQTDIGRMEVTGNPMDKAKFKVTSLRNIELTAPYMHDGRFATLEEVVDHYDHGIQDSPTLDFALRNTTYTGLRLSDQDKADLIAFLKTLTDETLAEDDRYSNPFE